MSSGSPKTQTVTEKSSSEPWAQAQPHLANAMNAAQTQFNQGPQQYFPGQTVAPMTGATQQGLTGIANTAGYANGLANQQWGAITNVMGPQFNPGQGYAAQTAMGMNQNPFLGQIGSAANASLQGGTGMDTLTAAAQGNFIQNPFLDQMVSRAQNSVQNNVNGVFNAAGRYGSGAHQSVMQQGMGDIATNMYGQAYRDDMANRMNAAGQLASYENSARDRSLQGALGGAGVFSDSLSQALGAYNSLAGNQMGQNQQTLQGASMLPGVYNTMNQGANDLLGAGQYIDQYNQSLINANVDRWNFNQQAPWDNIARYNAIASGQGQLGGTSTATGQQPYSAGNPLLQALGAAGSMATLFGMSDRTLKKDIEPQGKDDKGRQWYAFRYKWEAADAPLSCGVMAQEIEKTEPDLVVTHPSGFKAVDYGKLLERV